MLRSAIERFKAGIPEPEPVPNENNNSNLNPENPNVDENNNSPERNVMSPENLDYVPEENNHNPVHHNADPRQDPDKTEQEIQTSNNALGENPTNTFSLNKGKITRSGTSNLKMENNSGGSENMIDEEEKTGPKIYDNRKPPRPNSAFPHSIRKMTSMKEDEKSNADIYIESEREQHNLPERQKSIKGLVSIDNKSQGYKADEDAQLDIFNSPAFEKLARGSRTSFSDFPEPRRNSFSSKQNFDDL